MFVCTTWVEFEGLRFGEQSFLIEEGAPTFEAFVRSLLQAQLHHPNFKAILQPRDGAVVSTTAQVTLSVG